MDEQKVFQKAIEWIHRHTIGENEGITVTDRQQFVYPEVTGYYIPSLISIGEIELAKSFAEHLCSIQNENGAWFDAFDENPMIFDTGQILKGLMAVREYLPEVESHLIKGIEWLLSCMTEEGKLSHEGNLWEDETHSCELILLYTLSPILEAAKVFARPDYTDKVNKILDYYLDTRYDQIIHFSMFSHFYAYVVEALIDCGREEVARLAMKNLEPYVKSNGAIYGYNNVKWYCSTAMFQFAVIWYKLGEKEKADRSFAYACSRQNPSGGWYGSYANTELGKKMNRIWQKLRLSRPMYLKDEEISWAVKYYIDAKVLKDRSEQE